MNAATNNNLHVILGTGPLGKSVMRELVRQGKPVRMVNRSGRADVPAGVEVVIGDVYSADSVRDLTRGAAVVYQCAQPGYTEWQEKFPPMQAAIVEGVSANGAKLIVGENLYMYGEVSGPIHENLPYNTHTKKGKTRARMSELLFEAHEAGKLRVAMARGSDFFGPEALGSAYGERFFYPALAGKNVSIFGDLDSLHSVTYIQDFGRALAVLGEHDSALGQAWHVPNVKPITQREFARMMFECIGQPMKVSHMGKMTLRIGGLFIPEAREVIEMAYEFEQPFVVDSSKFERAFGISATPLPQAISDTVNWYRAHPAKH